ncbi:MAG: hypothetical protein AMS15_06835 [Planctomycetes bacterium DG_23]|nr:MAG: hypothetical protein AMS15_06835 [Planctomycetes bacterium DG_23]
MGILYIASGALGVAAVLLVLIVAGIMAFLGVFSGLAELAEPGLSEEDFAVGAFVFGFLAIIFAFIVLLNLILSVPEIIGGAYLLKYRNWARILCIVLSILNLPSFPLGTALGVYGLIILFNEKTVTLFKQA